MYSAGFPWSRSASRAALSRFIELARDKIRAARNARCATTMSCSRKSRTEARLRAGALSYRGSSRKSGANVARSGRLTLYQQHDETVLALDLVHRSGKGRRRQAYHAAGAKVIFEKNPFERCFRDVDTVIQQYQGRHADSQQSARFCSAFRRRHDVRIVTAMAERIAPHRSFARQRWSLVEIPWHEIRLPRGDQRPILLSGRLASPMESATHLYIENLIEFLPVMNEVTSWLEHYWLPEEPQARPGIAPFTSRLRGGIRAGSRPRFVEGFRPFCDTFWRPRAASKWPWCVVEMGTASYYTTLSRASPEPVPLLLARRIVEDEVRHYKHF